MIQISKTKKEGVWRYLVLCLGFCVAVGFYAVRLWDLQMTPPEGSTVTIGGETVAVTHQTVTVAARRGTVYDRDGVALVEDVLSYQMLLDATTFPRDDAEANELLCTLLTLSDETGAEVRATSFPVTWGYADEHYLFFLKPEVLTNAERARYEEFLTRIELDETPAPTANILLDTLYSRYHLYRESTEETPETDAEKTLLYDAFTAYRIAAIRYDLEVLTFDAVNPYLWCEDADNALMTPILEKGLRGVVFSAAYERVNRYPGYASHILGRTGKIRAEDADRYASLGYPMDAIVGLDGIEGAMEDVLHGTDGTVRLDIDASGNVLSQTTVREPIPGKDVYLTIDIDLQIKAEEALAENIAYIVESALSSGEEFSGEDANAGALVVLDPNNGAVLASATYPTYDLTAYDYTALSADETLPLLNRALQGTYAPGSVFKVGIAAAAMEDGILDRDTQIDTKGIYTYYDDYQPRCWIYTRAQIDHGKINVIEALRDSCNYFFFDVGRQLGATKMADFMTKLGLGRKTGVELPESAGILSSPAYTSSKGITWTGAATLQTAIGQAYNAYTPMQLAVYLSTLVNGGTRYRAHYVKGVCETTETPSFSNKGEVLERIPLDEETHDTLIEAMREVAENGSATRIFRGYGISVGAKTGTAEVGDNESPNAVFAGFAPLDDPELLCISVIENGASGTDAGLCVRDIFDLWFSE